MEGCLLQRLLALNMKEKAKEYLWRFLDAVMPRVIQARVNARVYDATMRATMRVMDAQRLSHCSWCVNRFSLKTVNPDAQKIERILACPKHFKLYGRAAAVGATK